MQRSIHRLIFHINNVTLSKPFVSMQFKQWTWLFRPSSPQVKFNGLQ